MGGFLKYVLLNSNKPTITLPHIMFTIKKILYEQG